MKKLGKNWVQFIFGFYQSYLSGYFGGNCRFYPTCSHYGIEAVEKWPLHIALWLTLKRLTKCVPAGPQGYDPVPQPSTGGLSHS